MSTIKSSAEDLTLNADGSGNDIKFQINAVEKASISSAGLLTSTTIDATALTGNLPAIDGSSLTGIAGIPTGVIVMWSGAISAIPAGWVICDGTNSTPNLTDRFVIHADADSGGTNDVGDTGGAHTVTLAKGNIPAHVHGMTYEAGGADSNDNTHATNDDQYSGYNVDTENGTADGLKAAPDAVAIKPKFYALAYIMKT